MENAEAFLLTDIGRKRAQNQDSGGAFPEIGLFVVADGMGGHRGGEVASQIAVDTIHEVAAASLKNGKSSVAALSEGAKHANLRIMERSRKEVDLEGMGTTTTSLRIEEGKAFIGHVGDSRCYLLKPSGIWQLTRDHSLVQEKLRAGMITREQLKTDRMKNVITRSVGFDLHFGIDVYEYTPEAGDLFLLCSDGLTGPVEDTDLFRLAQESYFTPSARTEFSGKPADYQPLLKNLADRLVAEANERGGDDNITVLLVRYPGKTP